MGRERPDASRPSSAQRGGLLCFLHSLRRGAGGGCVRIAAALAQQDEQPGSVCDRWVCRSQPARARVQARRSDLRAALPARAGNRHSPTRSTERKNQTMRPPSLALVFVGGTALGVATVLACGAGPTASRAGADAGGAGSGSSSGSAAPSGPVVTADTDLHQLKAGFVVCQQPLAASKIADGPFVLTDVAADDFGAGSLYTVTGGNYSAPPRNDFVYVGPTQGNQSTSYANRPNVYGARMFVAPGETLCVELSCSNGTQHVRWSGFAPYGS
jgi:hypothetical protein